MSTVGGRGPRPRARVGEGRREQLLALADRAGPLRRDEVAEDLADRGDAPGADPLERRLGVPRERARDAADLVAGREGEEPALAVPLLPQPRRRECEQRQRAALPLDRGQHAVEQPLLEAEPGGRAGSSNARRRAAPASGPSGVSSEKTGRSASCSWQRMRKSSRRATRTCTSASRREPPEQPREGGLHRRGVEREQLLELVDDQQGPGAEAPPARDGLEGHVRVVEAEEEAQRLGVAREVRRESLPQHRERRRPRRRDDRGPPGGAGGDDPGPHERGLSRAGRPDDGEQAALSDPAPQGRDLGLAAEEARRVPLGEGREAGVGRGRGLRPRRRARRARRRAGPPGPGRGRAPTGSARRAPWRGSGGRCGRPPRAGGPDGREGRRVAPEDRGESVGGSRAGERAAPREHLVEHRAEGEDVGARVRREPRAPARATGSRRCRGASARSRAGVAGRSVGLRRLRRSRARGRSRGPSRGRRGEEEVLGLEVAVDDAPGVSGPRPRQTSIAAVERLARGQRPALEARPQRLALEQLEDEVGPALVQRRRRRP